MQYILIHGSCHGAWCWDAVLPEIVNAVAIDLPSHGADTTAVEDVSLDTYVEAVITEVNKAVKPVVLVGHSAAGIVISAVAERIPDQISRLIYLCAYAPKNGDTLHVMRRSAKRQLTMPAIVRSEDGLSYTIDPIEAPEIFYHDCDQKAVNFALARLGPQPILPQTTPVKLGANYESVSRSYILCKNDHAIPPEEQERFVADWPEKDVYRLYCGHSPFLNRPITLARLLKKITEGTT